MWSQYKSYFIFSAILLVGVVIFLVVSAGYYPIASINGNFVSAHTLNKHVRAESIYFQTFLKTYETPEVKIDQLTPNDLKRLVLTKLIENILINEEIENKLGDDLKPLVQDRLSKIIESQKLEKAAKVIYGLDLADFEEEILTPFAKEDILVGRLFLEGKKFEDWLKDAKKNSEVKIFSKNLYWDGSEVQVVSN